MNTCSMTGLAARAEAPRLESSPGTTRHPRTACPAAATVRSINCRSRSRSVASLAGRRAPRRTRLRAAGEPEIRGDLPQKAIRHLHEHAGAVAGIRFAAAGAAVQEVEEDLEPLLDDGVRLPPFDVDDEADAAGVVLVARIVEAWRRVEHATAVFAVRKSEVKYNDLIRSIHSRNGSS
jgi:hypothetical protein